MRALSPLPLRRAGLVLVLAVCSSFAFASEGLALSDTPTVNVTTLSEGEALAKGFEKAFERFSGGPLFLTYESEGNTLRTLAGVRALRADGAVIHVVTDRGTAIAIPARRVLVLTDERPVVP